MNENKLSLVCLAAAAAAAALTLSSPAAADVRWTHDGRRSPPVWIQAAGSGGKLHDPIQFLFKNKAYVGNPIARDDEGQQVTDHTCAAIDHRFRCQVQIMYDELWDGDRIPDRHERGGDWYNHDNVNGPRPTGGGDKACADNRLTVLFETPPRAPSYDVEAANNGGTGTTTSSCLFNQYHARFWVDSAHQNVQPSHDDLGSWMLGSIHHEKFKFRTRKHQLDMSWDQAVDAMMHAMHRVCQRRRWGIYPGARHTYQKLHWSGRINRLTTRRTRDGCACA